MEKSIGTADYQVFLRVLKQSRKTAGLTQTQLAERIAETQSFVSKVERGDLRLDFVQLRTVCRAMGLDLEAFVKAFEAALRKER